MSKRVNIATLVVAVAATLGIVVLWLSLASALPSDGKEYRVKAVVGDVDGLAAGANVTIAGLKVGRIESIERRDGKGVIEVSVQDANAPLPEDTRFGVRLRTVVGENYLELYPGRSDVDLEPGGVLPEGSANEFVDVDEILDSLRGQTRQRAREILRSVGGAVAERGKELNDTVKGASGFIENAVPLMDALDDRRSELARLVDDLGVLTAAIGDRGTTLRELVHDGRMTAEAMAARDDALRAMLERFPDTLRQVRRTTTILDAVSGRAAPVVANLGYALRDLEPAVHALGPAAVEGRAVMRELSAAAPLLEGTLDRVTRLAPAAARALPALRRALCEVNPALKYLSPYDRDLAGFIQNFGSSGGYYDANAHAARLMVVVGESSQPFTNPAVRDALDLLLANDAVAKSYLYRYEPLPGAGNAGITASADMATGRKSVTEKYPRVRAEC